MADRSCDLVGSGAAVMKTAADPTGLIVAAFGDGQLGLFTPDGEERHWPGHLSSVNSLDICQNRLASASEDGIFTCGNGPRAPIWPP